MLDVTNYEETQETMALLKILTLGTRQVRGRQGRAGIAGRQAPAPQEGAGLMRFKVFVS